MRAMTLIGTQENRDLCQGKQDKAFKTREPGTERQRTKTNFAYFSKNTQGSIEHKKIDEKKA